MENQNIDVKEIKENENNLEVKVETEAKKKNKKVSIFEKEEKYKNQLQEIKDKYKKEKKNIREKKINTIGTMFDSTFERLGVLEEIYNKRRDKEFKNKINDFLFKVLKEALKKENVFDSYNDEVKNEQE